MLRLPRVQQAMLEVQKRDITREPIKIALTVHDLVGCAGARVDDHHADAPDLCAIGEASTRRHRTNRLGSNLLIELLVFDRTRGYVAA